MSVQEGSFRDLLRGENAFYHDPLYVEKTKEELAQKSTLPVSFSYRTESTTRRVIKEFFSYVFIPSLVYKGVEAFTGQLALFGASRRFSYPRNYAVDQRKAFYPELFNEKVKRFTIEVDGYHIDCMLMGTPESLQTDRWVVSSNGMGELYETKLNVDGTFRKFARELNANVLLYNHPGMGASTGFPRRESLEKAHRAMLNFLEDKHKGLGAKEIVCFGYSLGGGVQGDVLQRHVEDPNIKYVYVKYLTFCDMRRAVKQVASKVFAVIITFFGWNFISLTSSSKIKSPEIIIQAADVTEYEILHDSSKIRTDGVITPKSSLAKRLLDDPNLDRTNKRFIGVPDVHTSYLSNPAFIANQVKEFLSTEESSKVST